jgi:site-specific recombinase XerD
MDREGVLFVFDERENEIEPHSSTARRRLFGCTVFLGGDFMGKIDDVFNYAKTKRVSFANSDKKSKTNNSANTWDTYRDVMNTYEKWLQREHGLKDITRAKARHGKEYMQMMIDKGSSSFTISKFPHALHALQQLARESGVYKGLKLGRKDDLVKMKAEAGIVRKSSESKALRATSQDFEKVQAAILSSKSPRAQEVAEIHQIQRGVGCRIHEVVKMEKGHISFNDYGHATVYIKGKGGHERWVEVKDPNTLSLLQSKMDGKKDGATLFPLTDRKGNDKARRDAIKQVQSNVARAALRAGVYGSGGETYNTQSARKVFAQERVNYYAGLSLGQLQRELARRISTDPGGKLGEKAKSELQGIRNKIRLEIAGKRTAEQGHALRQAREFNEKELSLFLVSVDTGHFRISITRYYCEYPSKN